MDVLPLLIVISLVVVGLVVWLFFRMSSGGQFDDLETPAQRILLDDDSGPGSPAGLRTADQRPGVALGRNAEGVDPAGRRDTNRPGKAPEAKDQN
ncbi:MAG: Cytochrome oxidase maturation protein cbb3-type [Pseudomonadota bacterium]|jgi:cbb3-type cytochrome oxidase maturation protein